MSMSHRSVRMWLIPPDALRAGDRDVVLAVAMTRPVDPAAFLSRVEGSA